MPSLLRLGVFLKEYKRDPNCAQLNERVDTSLYLKSFSTCEIHGCRSDVSRMVIEWPQAGVVCFEIDKCEI
jgi:hypothetical protein